MTTMESQKLDLDRQRQQRFAAKIRELMAEYRVPGVAVGVAYRGQEWVAGFGVTNIDHPQAVDATTVFQIGSISKTITGTIAMRLVEAGKLDLDAPVRQYLPTFALADESVVKRVTMRHLLTHNAGWVGDFFPETGDGDDALARAVGELATVPQMMPLGEIWSYCNSGFYVAGHVIERITGQTFEAAAQAHVFDPLGMTMSFLRPTDVMTHKFAVGHHARDDQPFVARPWPLTRATNAAGGVATTVPDLLKYGRCHVANGALPNGQRLLRSETAAVMRTPQSVAQPTGGQIGVTWMLHSVGGIATARHGGGTNGQITQLVLAPDHDFVLALFTNATAGRELTPPLVNWALKEYLGAANPPAAPLRRSASELREYVGRYEAALSNCEISLGDDGLVAQMIPLGGFPTKDTPAGPPPPPTRLEFTRPDVVRALDRPVVDTVGEFLRDAGGRIAWFRFGSRAAKRAS